MLASVSLLTIYTDKNLEFLVRKNVKMKNRTLRCLNLPSSKKEWVIQNLNPYLDPCSECNSNKCGAMRISFRNHASINANMADRWVSRCALVLGLQKVLMRCHESRLSLVSSKRPAAFGVRFRYLQTIGVADPDPVHFWPLDPGWVKS